MRPLPLAGFALMIALGTAPAWAQSDTKPLTTGDAKKVAVKDPDEIVCVASQSIESRIPGPKECHTRRVWDEITQEARRNAEDMQQRSGTLATQKGG